jgi:hypothetical protein
LEDIDLQRTLYESMKSGYQDADAFLQLKARVESAGFVLSEVDSKGHCQFDAIARQIRRFHHAYPDLAKAKEYTFKIVRSDLAQWLRARSDDERSLIEGFLDSVHDGSSWDDFCNGVECADPPPGTQVRV